MGIENIRKDIDIVQHPTVETLRQENAKFLAAHPTDDAQIDYYTDLAMKLFEEFEVDGDWDVVGTRKNVATWYEHKKAQMELFRKHPDWSEEAKAIIFMQEEMRECNYRTAKNCIHSLRCYIHEKNHHTLPLGDKILEAIEKTLSTMNGEECCKEVITKQFVEYFKYYLGVIHMTKGIERKLSVGAKITRFVRKCCEEFQMNNGEIIDVTKFEDAHDDGDRTFDSFEKRYAKFADALSTLKIKKMTIMSLNFLDFMTMSNGNSWSTCHFINSHGIFHNGDTGASYHGAYKQGCLSYALDEPSFIFYTLPTDYEGKDYYRCQKMTRMCCQYSNGVLVTGKCYPANEDDLIERYRQTMQMVISQLEEITNRWTYSTNINRIDAMTSTHRYSAHYKDYLSSSQKPTISLCQKISFDLDAPMTIGHRSYCIYCGTDLDSCDQSWLQCRSHRQKMKCERCGKKMNGGEHYYKINGSLYCEDCCFYCAVHNRYEIMENLHGVVLMKDGEVAVCNDGMELLAQCRDCGVYGFKDKMLRTDNGYSCKKHVRKYTRCDICGAYVLNKDVKKISSGYSCCGECAGIMSGAALAVVQKEHYEVGDYVLMSDADGIKQCVYSYSTSMIDHYANRIVRITYSEYDYGRKVDQYEVTGLYGDYDGVYIFDNNCIQCKVVGVNEHFVGKTYEEARQILKGE